VGKVARGQPVFDPAFIKANELHQTKNCLLSHDLQEEGKGPQGMPPPDGLKSSDPFGKNHQIKKTKNIVLHGAGFLA